jgi:NAD(P)-dependent dehydrogenase (short-subunit alcohol dehydrogenase family)
MEILGKVAIVTGSGGLGSGRAIAGRFARDGAAVVVSDIDEAGGEETVRLIQAENGRAEFLRADIGIEADVRALIGFAERTFGGLDILVNNASAPYRPQAPLEHWFETVRVDLLGALYGTRCGIDALRRRGGGAIVNIGSTSALGHGRKQSGSPAYDVAKAGVIRLTTMLAGMRERDNIRVNCLVPDWVATPEVKAYFDALTPQERKQQGVPAVLTSLDEIAGAVVRLATDETLAGRVLVWWSGEPPGLIPRGDPGYCALE